MWAMADLRRKHGPASGQNPKPSRLNSWKEIAAFLDTSVRTVQRWEQTERLPVHRHEHSSLGSVYANPSEITAWFDQRRHTASRWWRRPGMMGVVVAPILITAIVVLMGSRMGRLPDHGRYHRVQSIAVLPFVDLSAGLAEEYLADAITEELIAELSRIPSLKVTSRTSMMGYKGTGKSLSGIGRELGVDAMLEGSILRSGARIHINAQLIHASADSHLWSKHYDSDWKDQLNLQHEIAKTISAAVETEINVP